MSDDTRGAIEDAIRAHIEAEGGDGEIVTSWLLVIATAIPAEKDSTAYYVRHPDQPLHSTLGLIQISQQYARDKWNDE